MMKNKKQYISPRLEVAHYTANSSFMGVSQVGNKEGVSLREEERRGSSSSSSSTWGDMWEQSGNDNHNE